MGFGNWIVSNFRIDKGMRVLELGCGTGDIWKNRATLIGTCSKLILSDFSEAMVEATKRNIGKFDNVEYQRLEILSVVSALWPPLKTTAATTMYQETPVNVI